MRTKAVVILSLTVAVLILAQVSCSGGAPTKCTTPADCPDPLRYHCLEAVCVPISTGCISDNECTESGQAWCVDSRCVACRDDGDCPQTGIFTCQAGSCVQSGCTQDEDCTTLDRPYCLTNTCVECRADAHCTDQAQPLCLQGTCRTSGCLTDQECTEASQPYCLEQSCVACRTDAHCTLEDFPLCEDNICVTDTPPCGEGAKPTSFTWPCPNIHWVCQAFGVPVDYQTCGFHTGTDICGTNGERIVSIASGKVVYIGPMWLDGPTIGRGPYAIIVKHSPGFYSTYGHNRSANVSVGDCVTKGQKIAEMGDLGYSYGPHLHIEVLNNTNFTGDWATPFQNACSKYQDLESYVSP
ncbi:MAG: M23 family metallopeptidase [Deltaproteobacteria bacterium]|nr:M23 family metallopeptidase [Deltaproteobacteria bacterium]